MNDGKDHFAQREVKVVATMRCISPSTRQAEDNSMEDRKRAQE